MDNVHADARFPSLRAGDPSATGSLHYGSRQQQQEQQQQHEAQAKRHLSNNQAAAPPPPPLPDLCLFPALGGSCPWLMPALVFGGGFVASIVLSCCFIIFCMIPVHRRRRRSSLLLAAKEDSSPDAPFPDAGGSHRGTVGDGVELAIVDPASGLAPRSQEEIMQDMMRNSRPPPPKSTPSMESARESYAAEMPPLEPPPRPKPRGLRHRRGLRRGRRGADGRPAVTRGEPQQRRGR